MPRQETRFYSITFSGLIEFDDKNTISIKNGDVWFFKINKEQQGMVTRVDIVPNEGITMNLERSKVRFYMHSLNNAKLPVAGIQKGRLR